jgi:1,4-alpha-glucan branching enzyme
VDEVAVSLNGGPPVSLKKEDGHPNDDDTVWTGDVAGAKVGDRYKYIIKANGSVVAFVDPCARRLIGSGSAVESVVVDLSPLQTSFRGPAVGQMVIYELHVGTFNAPVTGRVGTFREAIGKLDYLKSLGVNAVELMPVHQNAIVDDHEPKEHDWGYDSVHLYGVHSPYGNPEDLKAFVRECHDRGIAVLLDVVYNHLFEDNLLRRFGGVSGPGFKDGIFFYGDNRRDTGFGPRPDFGRPQVRAHISDNALMWIREYGVDGLRWDSTINIRNGGGGRIPEGEGLMRTANEAMRKLGPPGNSRIAIAEDLQSSAAVTEPTTDVGGLGFDSQWDDGLWAAVRRAVIAVRDEDRDLGAIGAAIERRIGPNAFGRVIYSENHDKVGHPGDNFDDRPQIRLPSLIDVGNSESVFAKRRSALAAGIVLTAPGIPMIFQGQEMLETRPFEFKKATPIDWTRADRFKGILDLYRDLIGVRLNKEGNTAGLSAGNVKVFHLDGQKQTLAYRRFSNEQTRDDVIVVANFSNRSYHPLSIGFPREGKWRVRFNSGALRYDSDFTDGDSPDTGTRQEPRDGLPFSGDVGIGPYSLIVLSQDAALKGDSKKGLAKDGPFGKGEKPLFVPKKLDLDKSASKIDGPDSIPSSSDQPESGHLPKKPLTKDPRFQAKQDFFPVPVFFGTNRRPRATYDTDFRGEFIGFFWPPTGWRYAILLGVAWLAPFALAIRLLPRPGSTANGDSRSRRFARWIAAALIAVAVAVTAIASGWIDAAALAAVALVSFALFRWLAVLREGSPRFQWSAVLALWLGSYAALAAAVAHFRAARERDDPAAYFGNLAVNQLNFGRCDVTVPGSYVPGSGVVPRPEVILGIELPEDPKRHIVLAQLTSHEEAEFFRRLREDLERRENRDKELFVFVHGYNNSFRDAIFRTALIARDLEFAGTAVSFSWPSRGEVEDYPADVEAVDYCTPLLKEFVAKVTQQSGARRIYLFGHSMGTRALAEAIKDLYLIPWSEGAAVKEIVLAAPDIPQNKFRDQLLPGLVSKGPRLTLYASSHDVALATSKAVNKERRAGQGGDDVVVVAGMDTIDASSLRKPIFDLGHNYAFGTPALRRDLQLLFQGQKPPREVLKDTHRGDLLYWLVMAAP